LIGVVLCHMLYAFFWPARIPKEYPTVQYDSTWATLNFIIIIIIINIKDWKFWSVPSPKLQLLSPTFLRSSNCSPSFLMVCSSVISKGFGFVAFFFFGFEIYII
jgi:hypothetical protein